jgi:nicotinamidase-related amidase
VIEVKNHSKAVGRPALLITDMISAWDFPDAQTLVRAALRIAPRITDLKRRFEGRDLPVIYANDNRGRWRSDFRQQVEAAEGAGGPGTTIARLLAPMPGNFFILKPKHSAFFCTPLELLLQDLRVGKLLIVGVSSDQCILMTASDARMRNLDVTIPRDCVAGLTTARTRAALRYFDTVLQVNTAASPRIRGL